MVFTKKSQDNIGKPAVDKPWSPKALVRRFKNKYNSDLNDCMVIGIDFGTT